MSDPPSIGVSDEQTEVVVDGDPLVALAEQTLIAEGWGPPAEVTLHFVDEDSIAELNETHMGHSGPTDVLSFPIDGPGGVPGAAFGPVMLGDVVLCPAVAKRCAPGHAGTLEDELALLVVHGLLHLLGMDHAEADERRAMQARERQHLDRWWGTLARDPWGES